MGSSFVDCSGVARISQRATGCDAIWGNDGSLTSGTGKTLGRGGSPGESGGCEDVTVGVDGDDRVFGNGEVVMEGRGGICRCSYSLEPVAGRGSWGWRRPFFYKSFTTHCKLLQGLTMPQDSYCFDQGDMVKVN